MKRIFLLLCLICLLLTACAQPAPEPVPEPEPVQTTQPEPEPEPDPEPAPEPIPEPVPQPEPSPIMVPGDRVTVDGMLLPGGSVWIEDTAYVRLREVEEALQCELEFAEVSGMFLRDQTPVEISLTAEPVEVVGETWVPIDLLPQLHLGYFYDDEYSHRYYTSGAVDFRLPEGIKVPALMYHAVSDDVWGIPELFVSPADMEAQLQYLQENGFTTIHFSDLEHVAEIEKPVLLTVDDGYLDNYTELYPLLQKYNAKATIFVITNSIGTHHLYFDWEQAREMADSGLVEIQSHTTSHPDLDTQTLEEQRHELEQSQLEIVRNIGREPYVFCYPKGRYNDDTLSLLPEYYNFATRMTSSDYYTDHNSYMVDRWYVYRDLPLAVFADMVE